MQALQETVVKHPYVRRTELPVEPIAVKSMPITCLGRGEARALTDAGLMPLRVYISLFG
jgi:hypothetical protein